MGKEFRHLRLVTCDYRPAKGLKKPALRLRLVPDSQDEIAATVKAYAGILMYESLGMPAAHFTRPDKDKVLDAIACLSPHHCRKLWRELEIIAKSSIYRDLRVYAMAKFAEGQMRQ